MNQINLLVGANHNDVWLRAQEADLPHQHHFIWGVLSENSSQLSEN